MRLTFEHLLGLPAEAALAILHASGIMDVEVVPTAAPPRRHPVPEDQYRTEEGEAAGYASTRVVAVEEDGRWHLTPRGFLVSNQVIGGMLDALAEDKRRRAEAAARGDFRVQLD